VEDRPRATTERASCLTVTGRIDTSVMERALGMSIARMKTVQMAAIDVLVADGFTGWQHFRCFSEEPAENAADSVCRYLDVMSAVRKEQTNT
jgi:hypothetical protein